MFFFILFLLVVVGENKIKIIRVVESLASFPSGYDPEGGEAQER